MGIKEDGERSLGRGRSDLLSTCSSPAFPVCLWFSLYDPATQALTRLFPYILLEVHPSTSNSHVKAQRTKAAGGRPREKADVVGTLLERRRPLHLGVS